MTWEDAQKAGMTRAEFNKLDSNGDGKLNQNELGLGGKPPPPVPT